MHGGKGRRTRIIFSCKAKSGSTWDTGIIYLKKESGVGGGGGNEMAKGAWRWADVKTAWGREDDAGVRAESAE